jgi:hypothetical protein
MNYREIFIEKNEFGLFHNQTANYYTFRDNENLGEFINREGNVMAQLYEAKKENSYFIIAGMFMGDMITKVIPYHRVFKVKGTTNIANKPHLYNTKKLIKNNLCN